MIGSESSKYPDSFAIMGDKMAASLMYFRLVILLACFCSVYCQETPPLDRIFERGHTNNWAVLVGSFDC